MKTRVRSWWFKTPDPELQEQMEASSCSHIWFCFCFPTPGIYNSGARLSLVRFSNWLESLRSVGWGTWLGSPPSPEEEFGNTTFFLWGETRFSASSSSRGCWRLPCLTHICLFCRFNKLEPSSTTSLARTAWTGGLGGCSWVYVREDDPERRPSFVSWTWQESECL